MSSKMHHFKQDYQLGSSLNKERMSQLHFLANHKIVQEQSQQTLKNTPQSEKTETSHKQIKHDSSLTQSLRLRNNATSFQKQNISDGYFPKQTILSNSKQQDEQQEIIINSIKKFIGKEIDSQSEPHLKKSASQEKLSPQIYSSPLNNQNKIEITVNKLDNYNSQTTSLLQNCEDYFLQQQANNSSKKLKLIKASQLLQTKSSAIFSVVKENENLSFIKEESKALHFHPKRESLHSQKVPQKNETASLSSSQLNTRSVSSVKTTLKQSASQAETRNTSRSKHEQSFNLSRDNSQNKSKSNKYIPSQPSKDVSKERGSNIYMDSPIIKKQIQTKLRSTQSISNSQSSQSSSQKNNLASTTSSSFYSNQRVAISSNQSYQTRSSLGLKNNNFSLVAQKKQIITMQTIVKTKAGQSSKFKVKENQDSFLSLPQFCGNQSCSVFGVYDGHGEFGSKASNFVKMGIHKNLEREIQNQGGPDNKNLDIPGCLKNAYAQTNNQLLTQEQFDVSYSGCTAITVVINYNQVFCANVGDSRALIGRLNNNDWCYVELSKDHKPNTTEERKRIIEKGGRVEQATNFLGEKSGIFRVWKKFQDAPGLAMSRSMGDKIGRSCGIIAEPEIIKHTLTEEDKFLIVASDGVWDNLNNQEVVKILAFYSDKDKIKEASDQIVHTSLQKWKKEGDTVDDITCLLAFFKGFSDESDDSGQINQFFNHNN